MSDNGDIWPLYKRMRHARPRDAGEPWSPELKDLVARNILRSCGMNESHPKYEQCRESLANGLDNYSPVNLDLLRLVWTGVQAMVAAEKRNKNLRHRQKVVTDEQILAIVNDARFPTRDDQARKLDITTRNLRKRLSKISGAPKQIT